MTSWHDLQQPGTIVDGRYRIDRVLGEGGMGIVLAATHVDAGHKVAIKILREELLGSAQAVERFLREAQAAVKLRGSNVATVLDVSRLPGGLPYIVMELLAGEDLQAVLAARGPLPPAVAVDHAIQACAGLAEAHANGIVHRDIKPANLFLTARPDGTPLVKVLDFGIAKLRSAIAQDGLTRTGMMMGSIYYMSPEQLRSARSVDARADVWSLAATLHHLLAGTPPFPGSSLADVSARIWNDAPAPLPANVPPGLGEALHAALVKQPEQRTADVASLAAALAPFGSAGADAAAERVARILRASTPSMRRGVARPSSSPPEPAVVADASTLGRAVSPLPGQPGKSPRARWFVLAVAGLIVAGVVVTLLVRSRGNDAASGPETTAAPEVAPEPAPAPSLPPPPDPLEALNPFVSIHGVTLQARQISAREYGVTKDQQPDLDQPVAWVTHAEAAAFCARHRARLPTAEEWERAAAGNWGITHDGVTGPLQEWTAELKDGHAIALGGFKDSPSRADLELAPREVPGDPGAAARGTVGFRCAR